MSKTEDPHFRYFAVSLEGAIARYNQPDDEDLLRRQKRQVETLVFLERQFRKQLVKYKQLGRQVYEAFIKYICHERGNILDARPYFRERQEVFTQRISTALRRESWKALNKFNFNYRFIQFAMSVRAWPPVSPLVKLEAEIRRLREELITENMPLAISRAHIFYKRTPKAHLSRMDLIQIACEGLMSAIDKFVPPFSKVFRSVAIGRMTGNFIEEYSETPIHFYPKDKRILYRVNKILGKHVGVPDFDMLEKAVNVDAEPGHHCTASEIANLMAAASTVSMESSTNEEDTEDTLRIADRFAAPVETQPDVIIEKQDALNALQEALSCLTLLERKLLRLKGVRL